MHIPLGVYTGACCLESLKPELSWMQVDTSCQENYRGKASVLGQDKGQELYGAEGTLIWKS